MAEPTPPTAPPRSLLQYGVEAGIARLVLDDAGRMNPLSVGLQRELLAALERVRADRTVRAVLLTASGRAFSVGADLSTLGQVEPGDTVGSQTERLMRELTNPLIEQLRSLPVPVVCAVQGAAAGAGAGLALAADIVLAGRSAYFYLPFVPKLGLLPDAGLTWFLTQRIGPARATALSLLGERLSAQHAEQWGLIAQCTEDADLAEQALHTARRLAALPAHGILETRAAFHAAGCNDLAAQLAYEATRQRELLDRPTFQEGVRAFFEKRPPDFGGR